MPIDFGKRLAALATNGLYTPAIIGAEGRNRTGTSSKPGGF